MRDAVPSTTRRRLLIGVGAAGVVLSAGGLAFYCRRRPTDKVFSPSVWFEFADDGTVTVNITKAEMGQHIGTAYAQILADELEVPWESVRLRLAEPLQKFGTASTGGSSSVTRRFALMSQAGAAGRIELIHAGSQLLHVQPSQCRAQSARVIAPSGASLSYGEILGRSTIEASYNKAALSELPLKPRTQYRLIGRSLPALDIPEKCCGRARYGIDAAMPGMIFARLVLPPVRMGGRPTKIDAGAARSVPGFLGARVLNDPKGIVSGWVVVAAKTYPAAIAAADRLSVTWEAGRFAALDERALADEAERLLDDEKAGVVLVREGDLDAAFAGARRHSATYTTGFNIHAPLEPMNALVGGRNGMWEVHVGTQSLSDAVTFAADALGVRPDKVRVFPYYLGGGFGRRSELDYVIAAAMTAKAFDRPVKLVYSRENDCGADCYRPASWQRLEAAMDANGAIRGVRHCIVTGWPDARGGSDGLPAGVDGKSPYDDGATDGADFWYTIPAHVVRAAEHPTIQRAFPPGWLRDVSHGYTTFAVECFFDELAELSAVDPLRFRLQLLRNAGRQAGNTAFNRGGAARMANVLRLAARHARWGRNMKPGTAQGLAVGYGLGRARPGFVACVADVDVNTKSGLIAVDKLTLAANSGMAINPRNLKTQIEGAALWGLSLALYEQASVKAGRVEQTNFDTYTPLRMAQTPDVEIVLVESDEPPLGAGEPGVCPVAPAIANAVARACGARLRALPLTPERVKAALKSAA